MRRVHLRSFRHQQTNKGRSLQLQSLEQRYLLAADLGATESVARRSDHVDSDLASIELCTPDGGAASNVHPSDGMGPTRVLSAEPAPTLRVLARRTYIPGIPFLVRAQIEVGGQVDRERWDDAATVSALNSDVELSAEPLAIVNGLGSTLVTTPSEQPFTLSVQWQDQVIELPLTPLDRTTAVSTAGTLGDGAGETTWSGIVHVTGDVLVPENHTLTIEPGTLVIVDGHEQTSSERIAAGIRVLGNLRSRGTESDPVTITAANIDAAWGEIHADGGTVELDFTTVTRAGNSDRGGHTNTGPALRLTNDGSLSLNNSNISDIDGKIATATSGQLDVVHSLMTRAVMGPEIKNTGLDFRESWLLDMAGRFHHNDTVDDNDGIYLHAQRADQSIEIHRSVIAGVQDDAIDTLGSDVLVQETIVRDATDKLISVFNGETTVVQSLLVGAEIGIETKGSGDSTPVTNVFQTTIADVDRAIRARDKDAPDPHVKITYNISNSILHVRPGGDAIYTDYDPADLHVNYSWANESWNHPGSNENQSNLVSDPVFRDAANHDYRLPEGSPAIDAGDPDADLDPDGTIADLGYRPVTNEPSGNPADFNQDGMIDLLDIALLCEAIELAGPIPPFDLTQDGAVDVNDMDRLIRDTLQTTRGDADLNGVFDTQDLVTVFQMGLYESEAPGTATWGTGDWNCDGRFTTADMVAAFQDGGYIG